jgi:hypothetical protein
MALLVQLYVITLRLQHIPSTGKSAANSKKKSPKQ